MDPIRPKYTPPNVQQPKDVAPADSKTQVSKNFEVAEAEVAHQAAAGQQQIGRPTYEGLAAKIQDGVSRSLSREQVLGELVDDQTKKLFGDSASPAMTAAITQAFKNDPHLSALFNNLYNKASRQGG